MPANHDPLRDLVRQYRAAIEPGPAHVEHARARLLARLATEPPARPAPRPVRRALLVGAVVAVALLWGVIQVSVDLRVQQAVEASLAMHQAPAPGEPRTASREAGAPRVATLATPPAAVQPELPAATETPKTAPATAAPHRRAAVVDADRLIRESVLLSRAREAQAAGDWAQVLELVDTHRKEHPHGVLLEERLILEASAACNADQRERGKKALQTLERRFPGSLAQRRVADLCEGTDE